jgi:hypothetical protein
LQKKNSVQKQPKMGKSVSWLLLLCLSNIFMISRVDSANPNYSYHVKIDDAAHANFQEKAETRKGPDAVGFYRYRVQKKYLF